MKTSAQQFQEKIETSPELQAKVVAIYERSAQLLADELAALAQSQGFDLSSSDFVTSQTEISDEQLSEMAAGFAIAIPRRVTQEDGTTKIVRTVYNSGKDSFGSAGPLSDFRPDFSMIP